MIYLCFWVWPLRGSLICLSIYDWFQGPFFKLKQRMNITYKPQVPQTPTPTLRKSPLTFNLFSWSCSITFILRRVSSSFFSSCRRLCMFSDTAAIRSFLDTEYREISIQSSNAKTLFVSLWECFPLTKCADWLWGKVGDLFGSLQCHSFSLYLRLKCQCLY